MQEMKNVIWPAAEKEAMEKIKAMKAQIVEVDKAAFQERVKPLFEEFRAKDAQSAQYLDAVEKM